MLKSTVRMLALVASFAALPAQAQTYQPNVHGRQGEVMLGGTTSLSLGGVHNSHGKNVTPPTTKDTFTVSMTPSAAVFVAPNFAVGLQGDFRLAHANKKNNWGISVGPQFIGHVPMAQTASLLPKLAVEYRRDNATDLNKADNAVDVAVNLDLALHLNRQVSLTVGPQVKQQVYSSAKTKYLATTYGVKLGVLGWL